MFTEMAFSTSGKFALSDSYCNNTTSALYPNEVISVAPEINETKEKIKIRKEVNFRKTLNSHR